jgi:hypothetical protein
LASNGSAPAHPLARRLADAARRQASRPATYLQRSRLDRALASGIDPGSESALAVRADQLVRSRCRRRLAASVEHLVADLDANRGWWLSAAVPFLRDQVAEARATLLALAGALRDADVVRPQGVAMVYVLLTDPDSPLYLRTARGALQLKAHAALECMLADCQPWCELPPAPPLRVHEGRDGHR